MAIGVLVLGESGTGKTFSIKDFKPEEVKILSVQKPILPFRGKYEVVNTPDKAAIIREMKNTEKKRIVIDDFQYVLGLPMMRRIGEKGWEKYNEIQQPYFDVLDAINSLPDDVIVYLTSHTMQNDDGKTQIKTIGKALDKYVTIEGLFMVVLGTTVINDTYYFVTQNNGANTLKSPDGMFPSVLIPNDLKYVDDKIRNYYGMDGALSDSEIEKADAAHKVENVTEKKKRTRSKDDEKFNEHQNKVDEAVEAVADGREELPFDEYTEAADTVKDPDTENVQHHKGGGSVHSSAKPVDSSDNFMNPPTSTAKKRERKKRDEQEPTTATATTTERKRRTRKA